MNSARLEEQLILHEGLKLRSYVDTEGYWTIGCGYNLSARGKEFLEKTIGRKVPGDIGELTITKAEALKVLRADIARITDVVRKLLPVFDTLSDVRQRVCVDMSFNMGMKALGFKKAIDAVNRGDWSRAARELYQSKWARQVDDGEGGRFGRADRLAQMLLTNVDYTR